MAIQLGSAYGKIELDASGVRSGVSQANSAIQSLTDRFRGMSGVATVALGNLVAGGITSIGGAIAGMAQDALGAVASNERLTASLGALVKREMGAGASKEELAAKTQELIKWQERLAIESPFSQEDVQQSFRMALSYGFTTDQAKRMTTAMIDFAAGSGATGDSMKRISLALGQVKAKGKLAGGEMLQLTEAGLNVRDMLVKSGKIAGLTTQNFADFQEKGLIPAEAAIEAITSTLENDFGGAAKAQSGTFAGIISSFDDLKEVALRDIFGPAFAALQPTLNSVVEALQSPTVKAALQGIGQQIGLTVGQIVTGLGQVVTWVQANWPQISAVINTVMTTISNVISGVVSWVTANWPTISAVIGTVIAAVVGFIQNTAAPAVGGLIAGFQGVVGWVSANWPQISAVINTVMTTISNVVSGVVSWVVTNWPQISAVIDTVLAAIGQMVNTYVVPMAQFLIAQMQQIAAWVQTNWPLIRATVETVFNAIRTVVETVAPILFTILDGAFTSIKAAIETAVKTVEGIIKTVMQVITGDWSGAWETIKGTVEGVVQGVINFLSGLPATMLGLGLDLINGLIDGIKKQGPEVIATIRRIIESLLTDIKNFLGIKSPSRVMMEIGENMALGMNIGYANALSPLAVPSVLGMRAVGAMAGAAASSYGPGVPPIGVQQAPVNVTPAPVVVMLDGEVIFERGFAANRGLTGVRRNQRRNW